MADGVLNILAGMAGYVHVGAQIEADVHFSGKLEVTAHASAISEAEVRSGAGYTCVNFRFQNGNTLRLFCTSEQARRVAEAFGAEVETEGGA